MQHVDTDYNNILKFLVTFYSYPKNIKLHTKKIIQNSSLPISFSFLMCMYLSVLRKKLYNQNITAVFTNIKFLYLLQVILLNSILFVVSSRHEN